LFYQLEGSIKVITQGASVIWNMQVICTCKSPSFSSAFEAIGLVIERKGQGEAIRTVYYGFVSCNHKLHEVYFELNDIEKTCLILIVSISQTLRTCEKCGTVMETTSDLWLKSKIYKDSLLVRSHFPSFLYLLWPKEIHKGCRYRAMKSRTHKSIFLIAKRIVGSGFNNNTLFLTIFYRMILYVSLLNNIFTKNNITILTKKLQW
jgi:hypothetical protein